MRRGDEHTEFFEIPTIGSQLDELTQKLENLDLDSLVSQLEETMKGIDELVSNPKLIDAVETFDAVGKDVRSFIGNLNDRVGPAAKEFTAFARDARAALERMAETLTTAEQAISADAGMPVPRF